MIVRFYEGSSSVEIIKESHTDRLMTPNVGWNVAINKAEYLVKKVRADYDNGVISIDLKFITHLL